MGPTKNIKSLVEIIRQMDDCVVYPATGLPQIEEGYELPDDVCEFYSMCGGIDLFVSTDGFSYVVLPPNKFSLATPAILGEETAEKIRTSHEYANDVTLECHTIVSYLNGDFIVIDLASKRFGLCYDAFHETYGLVGEMAIVARSFTELLEQLINCQGKNIFWLEDNFKSLGDAYDNI